jgi:hypothetical protein
MIGGTPPLISGSGCVAPRLAHAHTAVAARIRIVRMVLSKPLRSRAVKPAFEIEPDADHL